MVWVLLFILGVMFILLAEYKDSEATGVAAIIITIASIIFAPASVFKGIKETREVLASREIAVSLQSEIDAIRNAVYDEHGIIDTKNFKQSTNLSQYLTRYAEAKAEYNALLRKAKFDKHSWIVRFFWDGLFIGDVIDSLKPLQ